MRLLLDESEQKTHLYCFDYYYAFRCIVSMLKMSDEVPLPPELTSVTVIPETSTTLNEHGPLSPSSGIAAYIVYIYETRIGNPGFFAIDTIWDPSATTYSDTRIQFKSLSVQNCRIQSSICTSELSNILKYNIY